MPEHETRGIPCERVKNNGNFKPAIIHCRATGQFVAIYKHTLDGNKITVCEVQVFGEATSDKPIMSPKLPNVEETITMEDVRTKIYIPLDLVSLLSSKIPVVFRYYLEVKQ